MGRPCYPNLPHRAVDSQDNTAQSQKVIDSDAAVPIFAQDRAVREEINDHRNDAAGYGLHDMAVSKKKAKKRTFLGT